MKIFSCRSEKKYLHISEILFCCVFIYLEILMSSSWNKKGIYKGLTYTNWYSNNSQHFEKCGVGLSNEIGVFHWPKWVISTNNLHKLLLYTCNNYFIIVYLYNTVKLLILSQYIIQWQSYFLKKYKVEFPSVNMQTDYCQFTVTIIWQDCYLYYSLVKSNSMIVLFIYRKFIS